MNSKYKLSLLVSIFVVFLFVSVKGAEAAIITLVPEKRILKIGEATNIDVKIDTGEVSINAGQVTIQFPANILEVIKIDKSNSVFSFWIDEPSFSNVDGSVKFIGGTPKGAAGKSLQVLRFMVKAKNSGSAEISLSDAAVTASDGKGTNVLERTMGTIILSGSEAVLPAPPTPPSATEPKKETPPVVQPQKVERIPVPSKKLPVAPTVKIPLYPDPAQWYDHVGETIVLWDVPDDVVKVAVKLDQNPNSTPTDLEKELVNGKNLGVIQEGIWYVHAQFKNNVGLGPVTHFKIQLDTTVPLSFEASIDNKVSENPSPQVTFSTEDALSGISHAILLVDGKEVMQTSSTSVSLPPSGPGEHVLLARIFDRANNFVEDDLKFEILPLPTPVVEFITRAVSQGELVFASGNAISNVVINARVFDNQKREGFKGSTQSDNSGNWKIGIDKDLSIGQYSLEVVAQDDRGALSYPSKAETFKVRSKIVLSIGNLFDIGWFDIIITILLLIVLVAGFIGWRYVTGQKTREAYRIIVGRDIEKLSDILTNSLKELEDIQSVRDSGRKVDSTKITALIDHMKDTVAKMKKYIGEEVDKMK